MTHGCPIRFKAVIGGLAVLWCAAAADAAAPANYARPFEPPTRPAFLPLPPGAVEPRGWLRDWCLAAKDGYTGHMDEVDDEFKRAWAADHLMTGTRLDWPNGAWPYEGGGYWFDGLIRLGYALHDDALIQQATNRMNVVASHMAPSSILFLWWLDRNNPADRSSVEINSGWPLWACGLLGRSLSAYYAAAGNPQILQTLQTAYNGDHELLKTTLSNPWPALDTYTWTGNPAISNALATLFTYNAANMGVSAWDRYSRMPDPAPGAEPNDHVVHFLESTTPWAVAYLWTGDARYLQATLGWHDLLARVSMQPSGVPVADEYYGPTGAFRGTETCDVAGYVWSQLVLLGVTGEGRLADRAERAFFNAGPATVSRDFKKHVYFQSPNRFVFGSPIFPNGPQAEGGSYQTKHSPLCCTAALNRIVPWYVTHMWMATYDNGLAATCYGPCKVTARVADQMPVEITCVTDYPFNEVIDLAVTPAQAAEFPLSFHIPGWCAAPELCVNGTPVAAEPDTNGFVRVSRLWTAGDTVRLCFPMTARVETGRDYNAVNAPYAAVSYGPLLFARAIPDTADANTPDPAARWRFALDLQDPAVAVTRQTMPAQWDWPLDAPLKLQIHAVAADWNPDPGAPSLPDRPVLKQAPSETITLVPYGCTKFRISMFPVTAAAAVTGATDAAVLVDAHRTTNIAVSADAALGTVINAGLIIKAGDARLTVTNAFLANGTEEVRGGTLELGDGAGDLPEALRGGAGLAFWVDANRNVATALDGTVTNWCDVREAQGGSDYLRARPYGAEPAPTLVTGGDDVARLRLVDFGTFSSGRWLQWQNAGGYRNAIGNIRAVFLAVSCTNGTGFLLGDWTGSGWGGAWNFHVGGSTTDGLDATWWYADYPNDAGQAQNPVRRGLTYVNGILTDGMRELIPRTGTILSVQTVSSVLASTFCNDRNLKAGNWAVPADRQGGGRIGEALIYTAELTESQRRQVEAYLMKKWLSKSVGAVRVAPGATLAATATNTLDLAAVTGAGTLAVTGAGRVTLPDTGNIAVPPIRLAAGASASGALCQRPGQPFALEGGSAYEVTNGVWTRTAQADASLAMKTGAGVLTVASVGEGVARVGVAEGTLRLAPPLPGTPGVLTDALGNGSFETHGPGRSPDGNGLIYIENQTDAGWTYSFGEPGGNCGLARTGSAFCTLQPPDGDWVLFLVNDCAVACTFTAPDPGRYEVAFRTAATANSDLLWHVYQMLVDGTNVIGSIRTSERRFERVVCRTPALSAGAHTLCFRGLKEVGMNRVSLVDAVELRPCGEPGEVALPNGGFESPTLLTESSSPERPYAYFQHEPSGAGWTFTGAYTGTTEGYGTWRHAGMEEGGHAAVLCTYNGGGRMSVPVTFPSAGHYRVTFRAACRTARNSVYYTTWTEDAPFATVRVTLDGVEAARVTPSSGTFTDYAFVLPSVTNCALTQTLAFQTATDVNWAAALIDDVRVFRLPPLANPGFEDMTTAGLGWTLDRGDWECGITTPGEYSWTSTSPEGLRCLVLASQGRASQNVTFEASGTYELSVLAAQSPTVAPGHDFAVTFDGMPVGSVRTTDTAFRRYAFRLPYVRAGRAYGLVIQGLNSGGGRTASLIDSVMLRKADAEPAAFDEQVFAGTAIALAAGTVLELDYGSVLELDGLSYGGVPYTGWQCASNTPFIRGAGSVLVKPKGAVLLLR